VKDCEAITKKRDTKNNKNTNDIKKVHNVHHTTDILSTLRIPIEHEHVQPSSFVETGIVESATAY
jgi:hypothetical protein